MSSLTLIMLLTLANFFYQVLLGKNDWAEAAERSFFQATAIVLAEMARMG